MDELIKKFVLYKKNLYLDNVDNINKITSAMIVLLLAIACSKTYWSSAIVCYSPNPPSGSKYEQFIDSYCWSTSTYTFPKDNVPHTVDDWKSDKITQIAYYQWIPLLLLMQAFLFYFPHYLWRIACDSYGVDLANILEKTKEMSDGPLNSDSQVQVLGLLEDMLFIHREYRHGVATEIKRRIHNKFRFIIASKRMATMLSMQYIGIKCLYIINVIGQMWLVKGFLNLHILNFDIFNKFSKLVFAGEDLEVSEFFPRMTFCLVKGIRSVGVSDNSYMAQCSLPVNMVNEKIYVLLLLWMPFVAFVSIYSLILWMVRFLSVKNQMKEIKKHLILRQNYRKVDEMRIKKFVEKFLRRDGLFILYMIKGTCGDVVTSSLVNGLYQVYNKKYTKLDFNRDESEDENASLALKLERGRNVRRDQEKPSAPDCDKSFEL